MYFYLGYAVLLYFAFILFPWWFSHGLARATGGWLLTPAYPPFCFCSRRYVLATSFFVSFWSVFCMHLRTIVSLLICMSLGSPVYSEIFVYVWRQSFLDLGEAVQNPNVSNSWRDETGKKKCFNFTHRYKSQNCFKPSVTWGEEFFNIWKQRLEASSMSDKKSWKL